MNANHLRELLEQGHRVVVQKCEGKVHTFFTMDDYMFVGKDEYSRLDYYTDREIQDHFTNDYKVVTPAPKMLEVGDEVRVVSSYNNKKTIRGLHRDVYTIKLVYENQYHLSHKNWGERSGFLVPRRAVAKLPPKEDETIKIIDGKTYKLVE